MLEDKGVDIVVGGRFGENMEAALAERDLKYRQMSGYVKETLQEHLEKKKG